MKDYYKKKSDKEKPMWQLLDLSIIQTIVHVLTFGAKKYSVNSWQRIEDAEERYWGAMMRHLEAHRERNYNDKESGMPHLWHAFCSLYFLIWFHMKRTRNRNPFQKLNKTSPK